MAKYQGSYSGIGRMLRSGMLLPGLEAKAAEIVAAYQIVAPTGDPADGDRHPGRLRSSLSFESAQQRDGRSVVNVVSNDPNFLAKEFGSKRLTRDGKVVEVEGAHALIKAIGMVTGL